MSLSGLFIGAVYESTITGLRVVNASASREDVRTELLRVLNRLTREAAAAEDVGFAQDARFRFDTASLNNIEYLYDSGAQTLTRQDSSLASAVTLLRNITAFDFDYLENGCTTVQETCDSSSGCGTAGTCESGNCCLSEVRVVQVTMTASRNNESITVTGSAHLRNM